MKIGIVGWGSIAQRHATILESYQPDLVILSKRKDVLDKEIVSAWKEFKNRGPYDIILITNETHKHVDTILRAIELKPRALFIEKPLAHRSSRLPEIEKKLRTSGVSVWVAYCLQFYSPLLRVRELLRKKAVGKIYYMRVAVGQDLAGWRKRDYRLSYSSDRRRGGGVLYDLVHDINYPSWLLQEPLTPVSACVQKISALQINADDYAESVLAAPSGVLVSVHQDYLRVPGWRSLEIAGTKGTMLWDSIRQEIVLQTSSETEIENVATKRNDMYERQLEYFINRVAKRKYFSNMFEGIRDVTNIESIISYAKRR